MAKYSKSVKHCNMLNIINLKYDMNNLKNQNECWSISKQGYLPLECLRLVEFGMLA